MKQSHFYISIIVSGLCLILSVTVIGLGSSNQKLQAELQKQQSQLQAQQEEINKGNAISQQVGPSILRDMASVSVKNDKMKELLSKHGYTVNVQAPEAGKDGATPAPAATPAPSTTPAP